jgi:hypothetical protein
MQQKHAELKQRLGPVRMLRGEDAAFLEGLCLEATLGKVENSSAALANLV